MKKTLGCIGTVSLAALAPLSPAAWAQDGAAVEPSGPTGGSGIEEVIVTARKTQEAAQDLPITIAAFSEEELENKVVLNIQDIQSVTPGLNVSVNSQGGAPVFAIRGTATQNLIDGGVALYFDDVPIMSSYGLANAFYDIASIEILKGPQGTQFGTNTTGGTITVRAKKPTDVFEGYIKGGYGNFNRTELEGMVNIPVNDVFKFRFAGNFLQRDGFVDNPIAGGSVPKEFADEDHYSLRGSMRAETNLMTNDIVVDYYNEDRAPGVDIPVLFTDTAAGPGTNPANFGAQLGTPDTVYIGADLTGVPLKPLIQNELWGAQHVLNFYVNDQLTVRNVLGYRDDASDTRQNSAGSTINQINVLTSDRNEQWTEDLTLQFSLMDDRLRASVGGYFASQRKQQGVVANASQSLFLAFTGLPLVADIHIFSVKHFDSAAAYSNVDFDVTDRLTVIGGIRYNWDSGDLRFGQALGIGLPDNGTDFFPSESVPCSESALVGFDDVDLDACVGRRKADWKAPSYTFGANYSFGERSLAYAKVSGGYLAGGFNTTIREVPAYDPEKNLMYETGLKSDWDVGGRPVRTNVSLYYGKIKDKQVVTNVNYDDGGSGNGVFNAAKETVYGSDFEVEFLPTDSLTLSANYSYLHAEFDEFQFPEIGGPEFTLSPSVDLSGNTPAGTPKHQLNLGATYRWPVDPALGDVTTTLTGYYTSKIDIENVDKTQGLGDELDTVDSYWLANASLGWANIAGSNWSSQLWVQNLFDEEYAVSKSAQFAAFGYATVRYGAPRTYGITATYNF